MQGLSTYCTHAWESSSQTLSVDIHDCHTAAWPKMSVYLIVSLRLAVILIKMWILLASVWRRDRSKTEHFPLEADIHFVFLHLLGHGINSFAIHRHLCLGCRSLDIGMIHVRLTSHHQHFKNSLSLQWCVWVNMGFYFPSDKDNLGDGLQACSWPR